MKRLLFSIALLFLAFCSQAQFRMAVNGTPSWTSLGGGLYSATVTFHADLTGNSYAVAGIVDTMRLFTSRGQVFEIDSVWGKTFSQATLRVEYLEGVSSAPVGQCMVYNPNGSVFIPDLPFGSTGATAQFNQMPVTYNAANAASGSGVTVGDKNDIDVVSSTDWRVDTAAITLVKMAANSVDSSKIVAGGIGNTDLSPAIVSWSKLAQAVKDSISAAGTSTLIEVPVAIFVGESNSGGQALNSDLTSAELLPQNGVLTYNIYADSFQTLDIGTNNQINHLSVSLVDSLRSATQHGWENGIAQEYSKYGQSKVYIVKTGQGGSTIAMWDEADTFNVLLKQKIIGATAALATKGLKPKWYIWFSFGINNALAGTDTTTFKANTLSWVQRIHGYLGQEAPVFSTEFTDMGTGGTAYKPWDRQIKALATTYDWWYNVPTEGLAKQDVNHWNAASMKTIAQRMGSLMRDTIGLSYGRGTIASSTAFVANSANYIPVSDGSALQNSNQYYNSSQGAIYQGTAATTYANDYLHRWDEGGASFRFRTLLTNLPCLEFVNSTNGIAGGLIAGTVGSGFGFDGGNFTITKYYRGAIANHTYSGNTNAIVVDTFANTAISKLALGGLTPQNTYPLDVAGTARMTTATVTGAATIGTTLGVTGATTLSSTLGVTGAATLSSTLGVTGLTTALGNIKAGASASIPLGLGTRPGAISNVSTNDQGSILIGVNMDFATAASNAAINTLTNASVNGIGIILKSNGVTGDGRPGSLLFYSQKFGSATAGGSYTNTPTMVIDSSKSVGIGTATPSASSALDLTSTTRGFLAPRMTVTQLNAISTPARGLQVYNTTTNKLNYYNGSAWRAVVDSTTLAGLIPTGTAWVLGGQNTTANANIGTTDAFRFGITTNGTARQYFSSDGRIFSGTVTDWKMNPSDSFQLQVGSNGWLGSTAFGRYVAAGLIAWQVNHSTGASAAIIPDNTAAAYSMNISGGATMILANTTDGAEVLTLGSNATGATTAFPAKPTGKIASGLYTPTITLSGADTLLNTYTARFQRIDSVLIISGSVRVGHTVGSTAESFTVSLPPGYTTDLTSQFGDVSGTVGVNQSDVYTVGLSRLLAHVEADTAADKPLINYEPIGTGGVAKRNRISFELTLTLK